MQDRLGIIMLFAIAPIVGAGEKWVHTVDRPAAMQYVDTQSGIMTEDDGALIVGAWGEETDRVSHPAECSRDPMQEWDRGFCLRLDKSGKAVWQKVYSRLSAEWFEDVDATADGGYVLAGATGYYYGDSDAWCVKIDATGAILWERALGGPKFERAHAVCSTRDGGALFVCETRSFGASGIDAWCLKLSSAGAIEWQTRIGGAGDDILNHVRETPGGAYLLVGETTSFGAGSSDGWYLKLDPTGSILWQRTIGTGADDALRDVAVSDDGSALLVGMTGERGWCVKTDAGGRVVWQKRYASSDISRFEAAKLVAGGGYLVAGRIDGTTPWFVRIDSAGSIVWQRRYRYGGVAEWVGQTSEGGFMITGTTLSTYARVIRLSALGGTCAGMAPETSATVASTSARSRVSTAVLSPTDAKPKTLPTNVGGVRFPAGGCE